MDLGFKLAVSNRNLKHPTSRQIFGDTSGLLCKNDQILRHMYLIEFYPKSYYSLCLVDQSPVREQIQSGMYPPDAHNDDLQLS